MTDSIYNEKVCPIRKGAIWKWDKECSKCNPKKKVKAKKEMIDNTMLIIQVLLNVVSKKIKDVEDNNKFYSIWDILYDIEEGYIQREIREELNNIIEQEGD